MTSHHFREDENSIFYDMTSDHIFYDLVSFASFWLYIWKYIGQKKKKRKKRKEKKISGSKFK